jgi:hypothetical protein
MNATWLRMFAVLWFWTVIGTLGCLASDITPIDLNKNPQSVARPEKLPVPGTTTDERVREFSNARQEYLSKRAALYEQSRHLTQQQREEVRERLREQQEQQAQAREALRKQLSELREQLPSHRDLIDEAQERAGSRPRRGE